MGGIGGDGIVVVRSFLSTRSVMIGRPDIQDTGLVPRDPGNHVTARHAGPVAEGQVLALHNLDSELDGVVVHRLYENEGTCLVT